MSLPSLKPASSPRWYIWRTFSALHPQRPASSSGEYGLNNNVVLLSGKLLRAFRCYCLGWLNK